MSHFAKRGFIFHELMTTDIEQAKQFYTQITGLVITSGPYPMLIKGKQPIAGLVGPRPKGPGWPSGGPEAHWIAYIGVDDVDATVNKAQVLGGKILLPPTDIPGFGRAAVLKDPQGAAFGIFTRSPQ